MTDWNSIVRGSLIGLEPYRPGASLDELKEAYGLDEIVKLNWNEGLEGPFPGVEEEVVAELDRAWIYPAEAYSDLRESVAAWLGTSPERIVPSHGIQALIATVAHAFLEPGDSVVLTTPTYGLYATTCAGAGAEIVEVPSRDLRHDVDALAAAARETSARLVWLCDPNNPTGALVERDEWERLLDGLPERCAVVVDEAYVEYVDPSVRLDRLADVEAGAPIVVMRTFSKIFGLAGLRLGYAVVGEQLAELLDVVQEPFNVNRAALAAGRASLRRASSSKGAGWRMRRGASAWPNGSGGRERRPPPKANFLLVDAGVDDSPSQRGLARWGFLVRAGVSSGSSGFVRITSGPAADHEAGRGRSGRLAGELSAAESPAA